MSMSSKLQVPGKWARHLFLILYKCILYGNKFKILFWSRTSALNEGVGVGEGGM